MKILAFTRHGHQGASSRYRLYQYLPHLQNAGFEITVVPLLDDYYLQQIYSNQSVSKYPIIRKYMDRCRYLLRLKQYNLVWIEKELLPWLPAWSEILLAMQVPYVVDYDDAQFHRYDDHSSRLIRQVLGKKIDVVMRHSALVVAGNPYLANRAERAGAKNIAILPTVVDLDRYPKPSLPNNEVFTIGWIGSLTTTKHLNLIQPALHAVCQGGNAKLMTIGSGDLTLEGVEIERKPWIENQEVDDLQQCDVGIMPLPDLPWERGKCGFKLIQYMACARATVGSPVGVNQLIIEHGVTGFQATTPSEWVESLQRLQHDRALCHQMGKAGRQKVEMSYCLQVTALKLVELLYEVGDARLSRNRHFSTAKN